jgi:hypothetical protein
VSFILSAVVEAALAMLNKKPKIENVAYETHNTLFV